MPVSAEAACRQRYVWPAPTERRDSRCEVESTACVRWPPARASRACPPVLCHRMRRGIETGRTQPRAMGETLQPHRTSGIASCGFLRTRGDTNRRKLLTWFGGPLVSVLLLPAESDDHVPARSRSHPECRSVARRLPDSGWPANAKPRPSLPSSDPSVLRQLLSGNGTPACASCTRKRRRSRRRAPVGLPARSIATR